MASSPRSGAAVAAICVSVLLMPAGVFAATGGTLILGRSNTASTPTVLENTRAGSVALRLETDLGSTPNFAVSNSAKIARLNADQLDGVSVEGLQRRSRLFSPGTYSVTVPSGVQRAVVRLWGGGGGGGIGGSGGGQGGYLEILGVVTPGSKLTIKVGGGGAAAAPGTYEGGADGGTTTASTSGWSASALGGQGGSASNDICTFEGNAPGGGADSGAALALDGREGAQSGPWTCGSGGVSQGGRSPFSEVGAGGNGTSTSGTPAATAGKAGAALLEFV